MVRLHYPKHPTCHLKPRFDPPFGEPAPKRNKAGSKPNRAQVILLQRVSASKDEIRSCENWQNTATEPRVDSGENGPLQTQLPAYVAPPGRIESTGVAVPLPRELRREVNDSLREGDFLVRRGGTVSRWPIAARDIDNGQIRPVRVEHHVRVRWINRGFARNGPPHSRFRSCAPPKKGRRYAHNCYQYKTSLRFLLQSQGTPPIRLPGVSCSYIPPILNHSRNLAGSAQATQLTQSMPRATERKGQPGLKRAALTARKRQSGIKMRQPFRI